MHNIESFHAIANLVDRTCRCRYDALGGLTIEGLTASEARLALHLLEQVSENKDAMVALATGRGVAPAPAGPVQPSGAPNAAKWGPATPPPAPADKPAEETPSPRPRSRPVVPPADAGAPVPPPEPPEPHKAAEAPVETPPAPPPHTGPVPAQPEPVEAPKVEPAGEGEPVEANTEPAPDKVPRKKPSGPRKPPPRVSELEQAALLGTGSKHEDVEIVEHKDHGDGGRLLVRADGWRVKIDRNGREVTRVEGEPPVDVSDVPTADTLEAKPANERKAYPVTEELLETRMAREVVQHMLDHGITKRDELVEECLKLKERGAKAFANSKDREAVERRVTSTLIVMGKDAG